MINFGVREVANSKTSAPGWTYVPVNTGGSATASQPISRKRARTELTASHHETTAKQDAKIVRDLAALDRENHRDVSIPIPTRHRDNAGRVNPSKVTAGVRKILQSQKTFANHLADYEALAAISGPPQIAPPTRPVPTASSSSGSVAKPRSHKRKDPNDPPVPTPLRKVSTASKAATPVKSETEDTSMPDAPSSLSLGTATIPPAHPRDNDPLLVSRIPNLPSQTEIDALLAVPPLSYNEARGSWTDEDKRKPTRQFCEVCGYWGRVKCTRCGGRVCALECLTVHQEECFTRYGA